MLSIRKCRVPANTLLENYLAPGAYVDCYWTELSGNVSLPVFIFAFYTTPLFTLERAILRLTVSKPSTDIEARQLADRSIQNFAAWSVERRTENELLMCDFRGRTRSWFMVSPINTGSGARTRLYFGSAVVPVRNLKTGEISLGLVYHSLLGFHKIYSLLLLYSAASRLRDHQ
jgi:hypothetical protein